MLEELGTKLRLYKYLTKIPSRKEYIDCKFPLSVTEEKNVIN